MVVRTPVEVKPKDFKQEIERELSNFVKRENEFMARERRERSFRMARRMVHVRGAQCHPQTQGLRPTNPDP